MIVAAALPLLAWVALFHVADAAQTVAAFVLRAYRIATVPLLIYVVALWGVGLAGGYVAAFAARRRPPWMHGARGFWPMATLGLAVAGARHGRLPRRLLRRDARDRRPHPAAGDAAERRSRGLAGRQLDHEAAAAARARLAAHAAAVALGDLLDQRQAEADAAGVLGVAGQAEERLEDALAHRLGHAGAAVADLRPSTRAAPRAGRDQSTSTSPPP